MSATMHQLVSHHVNYFEGFPQTFSLRNYEKSFITTESMIKESFAEIAKKVAQLYVDSMQSPFQYMIPTARENVEGFNLEEIEGFRSRLSNYILTQLSDGESVLFMTEGGVPQEPDLTTALGKCRINFQAKAENDIFFLPYKSYVYISPSVEGQGKKLNVLIHRI